MNEKEMRDALLPLEPILQDGDVTEVMIDGPERVLVERKGKIEDSGVKFASAEALRAAIDAALALGGAAFKPGQTVCDTRLTDGSRLLAVLPPTAVNGPCLVIRKVYRGKPTMAKLLEWNSISQAMYDLLKSAIRARRNILVAGGTGSGKTTVLNLLAEEIPPDERVIVVEAFLELQVNHPRVVRLSSDISPDLSYADLIGTAAKMRPDRLIFGELRGAEVMRLLDIVNIGHDGSMMTIHAVSPEDALARMESMCLMANLGLGLSEIRNMIASGVNLITNQQRLSDGSRKITQVTEVLGLENDRYVLQPLMRYNAETGEFERTLAKASWEQS
jgi:pilus assembly protein CpaF